MSELGICASFHATINYALIPNPPPPSPISAPVDLTGLQKHILMMNQAQRFVGSLQILLVLPH